MTNFPMGSRESPVRIVDCSLTAGQTSLWDGLMTNEMLLPIVSRMDRAGLKAIEVLDPFAFRSCVTRLAEDPWERVRLVVKRLSRTPATVMIAGRSLFGCDPLKDDLVVSALRALAHAGIARIECYDPFNDVAALEFVIREAKRARLEVCGGVVFALGGRYDGAYFASKADDLVRFGCDGVSLLDFGGTLHPESVTAVLPEMLAGSGGVPLEVRTHCRSGRAEISCFFALELGAAAIHAASEPLSGGASVPSTDFFVEHLEREGYASALDGGSVEAVRDYFESVADYWDLPSGAPLLYDADVDRHQIPVGLSAAFVAAADRQGKEALISEILALRDECGNPPMAMPFAARLLEHADANLRTGRHRKLDLAAARPPLWDSFGQEDVLTAMHVDGETMKRFVERRKLVDRSGWDIHADTPAQYLLGELDRRPWVRELSIE